MAVAINEFEQVRELSATSGTVAVSKPSIILDRDNVLIGIENRDD